MENEWNRLEGVEATERILRAAVASHACEIHLSADAEGGTIFFMSAERIEFFQHLPMQCRDAVRAYLKSIAAIDEWQEPPTNGFGCFSTDGAEYNLEVRLVKGTFDIDVIVKLTNCS